MRQFLKQLPRKSLEDIAKGLSGVVESNCYETSIPLLRVWNVTHEKAMDRFKIFLSRLATIVSQMKSYGEKLFDQTVIEIEGFK